MLRSLFGYRTRDSTNVRKSLIRIHLLAPTHHKGLPQAAFVSITSRFWTSAQHTCFTGDDSPLGSSPGDPQLIGPVLRIPQSRRWPSSMRVPPPQLSAKVGRRSVESLTTASGIPADPLHSVSPSLDLQPGPW